MSAEPLQSLGPMLFVDTLEAPEITDVDKHHLKSVLRLREGQSVTICDGTGSWRRAEFGKSGRVTPSGETIVVDAPEYEIGVGFALIKGGKPELVCQKLCELGVDKIVVFGSERSVVRWNAEKQAKQVGRLQAVVREAAMQCRRTRLPNVAVVEGLTAALDVLGEDTYVADRGGAPLPLGGGQFEGGSPNPRGLVIGPEGGWGIDEIPEGVGTVRISQHVLRAETAAISSGVLLTALRGNFS